MGRVLLRLVLETRFLEPKVFEKERSQGVEVPRLFGSYTDLAARLAAHFNSRGRRIPLGEFWREELTALGPPARGEAAAPGGDALEREDVVLVTSIVAANMPPPVHIPGL
jgi:hypothetical protein